MSGVIDFEFILHQPVRLTVLAFLKFPSIACSKILTLLTNGFVGHRDTSFGEEFFEFTETQGESMVKPDGITYNLGWGTGEVGSWVLVFSSTQSAKRRLT
jgi:hypothetical protein